MEQRNKENFPILQYSTSPIIESSFLHTIRFDAIARICGTIQPPSLKVQKNEKKKKGAQLLLMDEKNSE
jgi:hypothetical protein